MKNTISIEINAPINTVFDFSINPENTGLWCVGILKEKVDGYPIENGTVYENTCNGSEWNKYTVVGFKKNQYFKLKSETSDYCVEYFYEIITPDKTLLTYSETSATLDNPLQIGALQELKKLIENNL